MHRRVVAVAVVLLGGLVLIGCGSEDNGGTIADPGTQTGGNTDSQPRKVEIKAANFAFDPTTIQLTAGEDVQFVVSNGDQVEHNLTVEGLDVHQDVEPGKTAEADTTKAVKGGIYPFHCEYHPQQMTGSISVT